MTQIELFSGMHSSMNVSKVFRNVRGVFRNNVDFFNNFTMLCSMVINNISMCFRILLPSFRRVWFSSDVFAQRYRRSERVNDMNQGHVKGVHDVNEVAIFWLMNFKPGISIRHAAHCICRVLVFASS